MRDERGEALTNMKRTARITVTDQYRTQTIWPEFTLGDGNVPGATIDPPLYVRAGAKLLTDLPQSFDRPRPDNGYCINAACLIWQGRESIHFFIHEGAG